MKVSRVVPLLFIALSASAEDKENVQILKPAPVRSGCQIGPEMVFRAETRVGRPFEKVCRIEASTSELLAIADMTGTAIEKARKLACTCGADAVLVAYNSSETTPRTYRSVDVGGTTVTKGKRKFEDVVAFGIRFVEPPPPRPVAMKNGFRDLAWGQPPAGEFRRRPVDVSPMVLFERPGDSMMIGEVEATRIEYGFLDGTRLVHVEASFPPEARAGLRRALEELWGPPEKSDQTSATWARVSEETIATLKWETGDVRLFLGSSALIQEAIERLQGAKAKDSGL